MTKNALNIVFHTKKLKEKSLMSCVFNMSANCKNVLAKQTKIVSIVLIIRIQRLIKRQGKEIRGDMRKVYSIC
jgi:hypothetical protein